MFLLCLVKALYLLIKTSTSAVSLEKKCVPVFAYGGSSPAGKAKICTCDILVAQCYLSGN
jgi:hypothetical protein